MLTKKEIEWEIYHNNNSSNVAKIWAKDIGYYAEKLAKYNIDYKESDYKELYEQIVYLVEELKNILDYERAEENNNEMEEIENANL